MKSSSPSMNRAKYSAPKLVVPIMMPVETKFSKVAAQRPCLLPKCELNGPTSREPIKVPIVMSDEISCCTVGSMAHLPVLVSK